MAQLRVHVVHQTPDAVVPGAWQLRLQWCRFLFPNGAMQYGYRLVWLTPGGRLLATRAQTRLPSKQHVDRLFDAAAEAGWGHLNGDMMA